MRKDNSEERLLDILGQIDEKYIVEATPRAPKNIIILKKWLKMAAAFLIVAGSILTVYTLVPDETREVKDNTENGSIEHSQETEKDTEHIENDNETEKMTEQSTGEMIYEQKWDEKTITQQFSEFQLDSKVYTTCTMASPEDIGNIISEVTMTGYDIYEDKYHNIKAIVYEFKDYDKDVITAIKFEGREGYYIYINSRYTPETLGEFIDTLKLEENISFGSVWYSYFDEEKNFYNIEYTNLADNVIWEMLLSDRDLKNVYDQGQMYVNEMSISVELPLFKTARSLYVTADGYLVTNIWNTGKAFFIGEEKVKAFIDYVINNCEGTTNVIMFDDSTEEYTINENVYEELEIATTAEKEL